MKNFGEIIRNAGASVSFSDNAGIDYHLRDGVENSFLDLDLKVEEKDANEFFLKLAIKNKHNAPLFINEMTPLDIANRHKGLLDLSRPMSRWTILVGEITGGVEDLCMAWHEHDRDLFVSPDYMMTGCRDSSLYMFAGFLVDAGYSAEMSLKASATFTFERFSAACLTDGAALNPGETMESETLFLVLSDNPRTPLSRYTDLLVGHKKAGTMDAKISGWSPWDYYQSAVTESDVIENAKWLAERRADIPVEYIQLDHGFQKCEGDWLVTNEKFPHGLKWLADTITGYGFKPGLWLCPFLVAPESRVFKERPDWVIKTADGQPLNLNGYAVKSVYGLDCSIPEACDWIKQLASEVTSGLGFKYVKLDGANRQVLSSLGVLRDTRMPRGKAMLAGLRAFKEGLSKDAFFLNAFSFRFSAGIADAMRIGEDTGGRWDSSRIDKHHGERDGFSGPGEILRGIAATGSNYWMNRSLWINDPDYMVVRQKGSNSELTHEEARSWASCVSLANGITMLSDKMMELADDRIEIIKKVLPSYKTAAVPVDFFEKRAPGIHSLEVRNENETWQIVFVLNADKPERPRTFDIEFSKLGLDACAEYHVFEFWRSEYLGVASERISLPALQPHDCYVLCIRRTSDTPGVIGADTHITQGGIEITRSWFDADDCTLRIATAPCGKEGHVFIFVPDGFKIPDNLKTDKRNVCKAAIKADGQTYSFAFPLDLNHK